ncbi:hypothetical protein JHK82_055700 [Glycine max]|nr:hypothetical protein JHK82_055700 [Glycine max]
MHHYLTKNEIDGLMFDIGSQVVGQKDTSKNVVCVEDDVNLRVSTSLLAAIDKGCRRRCQSLHAIMR